MIDLIQLVNFGHSMELFSSIQHHQHHRASRQQQAQPVNRQQNQFAPLDLSTKPQSSRLKLRSKIYRDHQNALNLAKTAIHSSNHGTIPFQSNLEFSSASSTSSASSASCASSACSIYSLTSSSPTLGLETKRPKTSPAPSPAVKKLISSSVGRRQKQKGTKSHLCNQCGRSFSRSDMLTRHSRLHSGLKPYQCNKCLQVFSRSDHLSTHERTHTGEKPYQCEFCAYSACRRDMITRHMRTHTGQHQQQTKISQSKSSSHPQAETTKDN